MAFGSGQDIDITVTVGADGALSAFDKLGQKLDETAGNTKKSGDAIDEFTQSLNKALGASEAYGSTLQKLANGEISLEAANKSLLATRQQGVEILNRLKTAEDNYDRALKTGDKDLALYAAQLEAAKSEHNQFTTAVKTTESAIQAESGALSFAKSAFAGFAGGIAAGLVAQLNPIQLFKDALNGIVDAAERGSAVDDLTQAFDRLSGAAGALGSEVLPQLRAATANTITDFDLMKRANESFQAGIKPDAYIELTKAARALAEENGGDLKQSIEEVTQAFITGNVRVLQNRLGIIDVTKAQDDFAKSIGTTRDQLNKEGQVQAARNAILEASNRKIKEAGEITDDAGDKINQLSTAIQNQKDKVSLSISSNKALNDAIGDLAKTISEADLTILTEFLSQVITLGAGAASAILKVTDALSKIKIPGGISGFLADTATGGLGATVGKIAGISAAQKLYTDLTKDTTKAVKGLANEEKILGVALSKTTDELKKGSKGSEDASGNYTDQGKAAEAAAKAAQEMAKRTKEAHDELEKIKAINAPVAIKQLGEELFKTAQAGKELGLSSEDVADALNAVMAKATEAGASVETLTLAQDLLIKKMGEAADEADVFGNALADTLENAAASAINGIGNALLNGANSQDWKNLGVSIGGEIGTGIGSALGGPIGGAIGQVAGQLIMSNITKAIEGDKNSQKNLFNAAFGFVTGGASFLLGDSLFGDSDNAGTTYRKSIDKFFADAFNADRLAVIINGQLQQIKDLDFSGGEFGDPSKGFFDAFDSLPGTAQAAFAGVASAYNAALGQGEEFSGALAAVFANNLGGSLNNLQLMVQATGLSFEDLKSAAVEAFLDGKLSAQEAQKALAGIQQISEKGIPGALGAVTEAFHNLEDAGVKGGRASTDAIRDIGAEAQELGIDTIPELMDHLVKVGGASAEEVQKVMDALAAQGIDSIDEIVNATDESLIPALAALAAQNFPFKEAADSAKEFADSINELPEEKTITVNIKANVSNSDREIINSAAGGTFNPVRGEAQASF